MKIEFTTALDQKAGIIVDLLKRSYTKLLSSVPQYWSQEIANWEEFDRDVFQFPDTVGACTFLTWCDGRLVGLGSYDNRPRPHWGIIGHNCILPEFRGRGIGKQQIWEILHRFNTMKIILAKVSTNDHPFFIPAQRMYQALGFRETRRVPWERNPEINVVEYEKRLC